MTRVAYRKERNRGGAAPKPPEPNLGAEVRCALQWALRGTLLLWLLMLTWLCAALYDQVTDMKVTVHKGKLECFNFFYNIQRFINDLGQWQ